MELIIPQEYLLRLENYTKFGYNHTYNSFACRYVFNPPKTAELPDGYTIFIEANGVEYARDERGKAIHEQPLYTDELKNSSYHIPFDRQRIYEAAMTERREDGKRFKRYKFTAEELYALYQGVDLSTAQFALAEVDIYAEGFVIGSRIIDTDYFIGKVKGKWFYCRDLDSKRRIGTKGLRIIKKINPDCIADVSQLIADRKKNLEENSKKYTAMIRLLNDINNTIVDYKFYFRDNAISDNIKQALDDVFAAVSRVQKMLERESEMKKEIDSNIEAAFLSELSKYTLKEPNYET